LISQRCEKNKNMKPFYKKNYLKSWQLIKKNPFLLFFGLFASILGFMPEVKVIFNFNPNNDFVASGLLYWTNIFQIFFAKDVPFSGFLAIMGLFFLMAIVIVLGISSQGALINATTSNNQNFKKNWQIGLEKFWSLLGINLLNAILSIIFMAIIINPLISSLSNFYEGGLLYLLISIITFFLLIPMVIIIFFITRYGAAYVIIKHKKTWEAFSDGWLLFKLNWLVTIENAILLTFVFLLYGALLSGVIALTILPIVILGLLLNFLSPLAFYILFILGSLLTIFVLLVGVSLYGAYYNIIWANIFLEITSPGKTHGKLHRLAQKHFPHLVK
jgi:hypothetical protein